MIRKRGAPNDPTSQRALVIDGISVLHAMLDSLSEREAGVVAMRFGLTDGHPKTLDEIGRVYGVSRERMRQIESKTMAKLRWPERSGHLALMDGEKIVGIVDAHFTDSVGNMRYAADVVRCPECHRYWWNPPTRGRRRKYCSNTCRQAAYRARRAADEVQ